MSNRAFLCSGEANLRKQVKASGNPGAGRHQNKKMQKALMEYLRLGKAEAA